MRVRVACTKVSQSYKFLPAVISIDFDCDHTRKVINEMLELSSPTINEVEMECRFQESGIVSRAEKLTENRYDELPYTYTQYHS